MNGDEEINIADVDNPQEKFGQGGRKLAGWIQNRQWLESGHHYLFPARCTVDLS